MSRERISRGLSQLSNQYLRPAAEERRRSALPRPSRADHDVPDGLVEVSEHGYPRFRPTLVRRVNEIPIESFNLLSGIVECTRNHCGISIPIRIR